MPSPILTCVVAAFNAETTISRTLGSLISENSMEVLIINDGSTDKTKIISEKFCSFNSNFRLISQDNAGLGAVRNLGIQEALGKYITFCDADDIFFPKNQIQLAKSANEVDAQVACGTGYCFINSMKIENFWDSHITEKICSYSTSLIDKNSLKFLLEPSACNKIFLRDFLLKKNILFSENQLFEDVLFTTDAFLKSDKIIIEKLPLFIYDVHGIGSITSSINERRFEIFLTLNKLLPEINSLNNPGSQIVCLLVSLMRVAYWCLDHTPKEFSENFISLLFESFVKFKGKTIEQDWRSIHHFLTDPPNRRAFDALIGLLINNLSYEQFKKQINTHCWRAD